MTQRRLSRRDFLRLDGASGGALAASTGGKLPVGAALAVAREVCHALAYAHDFTDSEGNKRQFCEARRRPRDPRW